MRRGVVARWFWRQDPLVRIMLLCAIGFVVLVFLALVALPAVHAEPAPAPDPGYQPPASITVSVRLTDVYCSGPCCCGAVQATYHNHLYDRQLGYCRWFRPLRNGQVVTTTLWLAR